MASPHQERDSGVNCRLIQQWNLVQLEPWLDGFCSPTSRLHWEETVLYKLLYAPVICFLTMPPCRSEAGEFQKDDMTGGKLQSVHFEKFTNWEKLFCLQPTCWKVPPKRQCTFWGVLCLLSLTCKQTGQSSQCFPIYTKTCWKHTLALILFAYFQHILLF